MRRAPALCLAFAAIAGLALAAAAAIPESPKIARAVADANQVSGRAVPLLLRVRLRIGDADSSASGKLAVHPSGLARLELQHERAGFIERHLLQSSDYQASRDGVRLADPHPFLPPLFLLQATSGEALGAALASFGVAQREVVLGRLGQHDCYVFGGRRFGPGGETLLPSLWVDIVSYDPVRIVRADGVEFRLGPIEVFDGIRLPRFVQILTPSGLRARLDIESAATADAPAALFQPEWLYAPPADRR